MSKKIIKCKLCNEYKNHKSKGYCNACYQQLRYDRLYKDIPLKKCECKPECQEMIYSTNTNGKPLSRAEGHERIGKKPHNFKGYEIDRDGYILIHAPNHPYRTVDKQVRAHRLIYEHYLYIMFDEPVYIPKEIDIHHIDGNVQNNALINLEPLRHDEHGSISNIGRVFPILDTSNRHCNLCGARTTRINGHNGANWRIDINGYLCDDCNLMIKYHRKKFGLSTSGY
jgi:hypothetical protein